EFLTDSISTKLHANDNILDTDHGQFVKFCCEDVGNDNLKVILRVWDDANGSGVFGDMIMDTCSQEMISDNYNETWTSVKVEVAIPPTLTVEDVTISCSHPTPYTNDTTLVSCKEVPNLEGLAFNYTTTTGFGPWTDYAG